MLIPSPPGERRLLQSIVAVLALVPILSGLAGIVWGLGVFDRHFTPSLDGDSHVRYLSGLLFAIGLGYWSTVPRLHTQGPRFRLLTGLVLIAGLARLYAVARYGIPGALMQGALVMELIVAPCVAIWRERLDVRET